MKTLRRMHDVDEFGDYQTPTALAMQVCELLSDRLELTPASIIEPTCGVGTLLLAALDRFPSAKKVLGLEIKEAHVDALSAQLSLRQDGRRVRLIHDSFFQANWTELLSDLPEPLLVIGNPPWVTNSSLSSLDSANLPAKTNFQKHSGIDAMTGKSNFDISEWILIKILESLKGREATIAMLCKTTTARKVLRYAWRNKFSIAQAEIRPVEAATFFNAAVEACLLMCSVSPSSPSNYVRECHVYDQLNAEEPHQVISYYDSHLIADVTAYDRWRHLQGSEMYKWRSGIKHDCSKVMELRREGVLYRNGFGELVELEDDYLYPMLKSADLAGHYPREPHRWMLVTQHRAGDDTSIIRWKASRTWDYLNKHSEVLDERGSSIYRNRPRFSMFGVGDYSFSPWKVAISGFYKRLRFTVVGGFEGKPIVLDDTSYFISCRSEEEAKHLAWLLNSAIAREFYSAFIFWDAKRPITKDILGRLDLSALARELGTEDTLNQFQPKEQHVPRVDQPSLFDTH